METWPGISIVVPVFNAGAHLEKLIASVRSQEYPQDQLEIIVVDDDSGDGTPALAEKLGARVLRNGARHIERGKSIGLQAARHEFVLFLDADNYLVRPDWIREGMAALLEDASRVGAQSIRFHYSAADPAANRYCSLFGINDPLAFYLNRRDRLTAWETEWRLLGRVEDHGRYYLARFAYPQVPTLGSQGFLARRDFLLNVPHDPYFFHLEANLELIRQGHNQYVLLKDPVGHDHVATARAFVDKCERNIRLFYRFQDQRAYRWETHPLDLFFTVFSMVTVVRPLWDALRGFLRLRDWAWFLHVWFSWIVPWVYLRATLAHHGKRMFGKNERKKISQ